MTAALVLALVASLIGPPTSAGPRERGPDRGLSTPQLIDRAVTEGRLDRATADLYLAYALGAERRLPHRFVSEVPWDGTLPLLHLRERVRRMPPGPARAEIQAVLVPGSCGSKSGGASTRTSTHFFIEYGVIQAGLTIDEYEASLEAAWSTEVDTFAWAAPPLVATTPTPNRYHVVISNLGPGLYGFVTTAGTYTQLVGNNPNTAWNEGDAWATCMALNRNYSNFPSPPQASLDATTAHEFNHSIQFGYGAITGANAPDDVFVEGGATWMEDEVFDAANDNYFYLWPDFTVSMGDYAPSPYPYWVVFRTLSERYGAGTAGGGEQVMEDFWEAVSQSGPSIDLDAMDDALVTQGTTLADAYHDAAVALKFNVACTGGVAYPDCLEEGPAYVAAAGATVVDATIASIGGSVTRTLEDNYALNWISLPAAGPYSVTLQNNSSVGGQFRATVACLTASGMSRSALPSVVGPSSATTLSSFDPTACTSAPVAVVTNQSQTAPNPNNSIARGYTISTASPGASFGLTVAGVDGLGKVLSDPPGIDCPGDCFESYPDGTPVILTATPAAGWSFDGWSGDCTGTDTCAVTMTADRSVGATFTALPTFALDVSLAGSGNGTVMSTPGGVTCPTDCSEAYPSDASVSLAAAAAPDSAFAGWSGDCSGTGVPCSVTMSQARSVTATFIGPKAVSLSAKPKQVDEGERTRLRAVVSPCAGHEGEVVELYRGAKRIATKATNADCVATKRVRLRRTATFRAVSPQQDDDHLAGTSNKVKVRVRPA